MQKMDNVKVETRAIVAREVDSCLPHVEHDHLLQIAKKLSPLQSLTLKYIV